MQPGSYEQLIELLTCKKALPKDTKSSFDTEMPASVSAKSVAKSHSLATVSTQTTVFASEYNSALAEFKESLIIDENLLDIINPSMSNENGRSIIHQTSSLRISTTHNYIHGVKKDVTQE